MLAGRIYYSYTKLRSTPLHGFRTRTLSSETERTPDFSVIEPPRRAKAEVRRLPLRLPVNLLTDQVLLADLIVNAEYTTADVHSFFFFFGFSKGDQNYLIWRRDNVWNNL